MNKIMSCAYRGSWVLRYVSDCCKKAQAGVINYLRAEEGLFYFPLRAQGLLMAGAVSANVILSLILGKYVSLSGWLARGLLLLAAVSAISSNATWHDIKGSSVVFTKGFLWIMKEAVCRRRITAGKK